VIGDLPQPGVVRDFLPRRRDEQRPSGAPRRGPRSRVVSLFGFLLHPIDHQRRRGGVYLPRTVDSHDALHFQRDGQIKLRIVVLELAQLEPGPQQFVALKLRDRISITSAAETETLVVRYVFSDMARQSRNNYVAAIQKALAMDVKPGELLGVLEQYRGMIAWLQDGMEEVQTKKIEARQQRKTQRTDSVSLMRRLFELMADGQGVASINTSQVADWTPSDRELATIKDANKASPKYQAGEFVFFVAKPGAKPDEYKLIQGFSAARDFEDQLLLQIASRLGANNEQLQAFVSEFEASMPN
jgi:hypothetical protein